MSITLLLSADLYQGSPVASITLDGVVQPPVPVTVLHGQPSQRVVLVAAPGPHTVVIAFANDAWGGTAATDRNLYLDGVAGVAEIVPPRTFMSPSSLTMTVTVPEDAPAMVARLVTALTTAAALSQRLQTLMASTTGSNPMPVLTGPGGVLDPGHATIILPVITVTPAAPTFAVNAVGTFATLSAVPAGVTRTISGDGRVVLGAGGITLAVGLIASTVGTSVPVTIIDTKSGAPNGTLVLSIPVTAAQVPTALPPITVTPAAPTFAAGTSGVFAALSAVPAGATRTIIGDGRVALGVGGDTLVVGLTASTAGTSVPVTIADAKVGTPNVTLALSIPVTAAVVGLAAYAVPAAVPLSLMPAASQSAGHIHTSWPGFAKGHLPDNHHLVGTVGGQTFQFQQDSESHWISDPTVRAVSVSAVIPVPLVAGQRLDIQVTPTAGAPNRTPWITPAAMVATKEFTLRSYGGDVAARVFVTSLRDIVTNLPRDAWGTNPVGGWDVPISGPVQVMIRAWRYWRDSSTGEYSKWRKDMLYVTARVDGTWEFAARSTQSNYDIAFPGGTIVTPGTPEGPLEYQPRHACIVEAYDSATRIAAWGGPNDARVMTLPAAAFGTNNIITGWSAGYSEYTPVQFSVSAGSTLPSGITAGTIYWLAFGPSYASWTLRPQPASGNDPNAALPIGTGAAGTITVTPMTATYSGTAPVFVAPDGLPLPVGFTRSFVGVQWDEEYTSRGAKMWPRYQQGVTRYSSAVEQVAPANYYPNIRPWGSWLNMTGDNPGDTRIGYVTITGLRALLSSFDATYVRNACVEGAAWSEQPMWWDDTRSGRTFVGDNGPDDAGTTYPQMGPNHTTAGMNGANGGWLGWDGNTAYAERSGYYDGYSSSKLEASHMPCPWAVPAHLTGHPIFADQGVAQANAMCLYATARTTAVGAKTFYNVFTEINQPRGAGWALRAVANAEIFTATAKPEAPYVRHMLDSFAAWGAAFVASNPPGKNIGLANPIFASQFPQYGNIYLGQQYQIDIYGIAMGIEAWRGERPGIRACLEMDANFLVGIANDASSTGGSGWLVEDGYYVTIRNPDGSFLPSLRAIIAATPQYGSSSSPWPTTAFRNSTGYGVGIGAFQAGTYAVVHRAMLAALASAGIVSLNGDDARAVLALLDARFNAAPNAGIQFALPDFGGSYGGHPYTFGEWAIVPG